LGVLAEPRVLAIVIYLANGDIFQPALKLAVAKRGSVVEFDAMARGARE
jgi:hypothetical protein